MALNISSVRDTKWLTLEVCRQFQRGNCSRSDEECKFAHPPKSCQVDNGRVVACFDSLKVGNTAHPHAYSSMFYPLILSHSCVPEWVVPLLCYGKSKMNSYTLEYSGLIKGQMSDVGLQTYSTVCSVALNESAAALIQAHTFTSTTQCSSAPWILLLLSHRLIS